jgi:hypothetical protein
MHEITKSDGGFNNYCDLEAMTSISDVLKYQQHM